MSSLNVSCSVCKEHFKKPDPIYATGCGHVFHFMCMNKWRGVSTSCPQCRSYNPNTFKIYLNFDESLESQQVINDLKVKLKNSSDKNVDLEKQIKKKGDKTDALRRLYMVSEKWRADLEDKIRVLTHQSQLDKKEIESLKSRIKSAEKRGDFEEDFKQSTSCLSKENDNLKKSLSESETTIMILKLKIETLEQKLKQLTLELEKQFAQSFDLSMNNAKLKTSNKKKKPTLSKPIIPINTQEHIEMQSNDNNIIKTTGVSNADKNCLRSTTLEPSAHALQCSLAKRPVVLKNPNDNKIVIKNFPLDKVRYPLKDIVIILAVIMSITITNNDIIDVKIMGEKLANKVTLLVEFRTVYWKLKFLSNSDLLKNNLSLILKEYFDETMYQLFKYANASLRSIGYKYIAFKNNQVVAKRNLKDLNEILIQNQGDVDGLICKNKELNTST